LRLSRDEAAAIARLCDYAELPADFSKEPTPPSARRYLCALGREHSLDILDFQQLMQVDGPNSVAHVRAQSLLRAELTSGAALSLKELTLAGADLLQNGMAPGPQIGNTMRRLLDLVLDEPARNSRETLLALAQQGSD
jgi:tRNA nucleotidyltransferase (CCA-adding enzyme)